MCPQEPTEVNAQLITQNDFSFKRIKLAYCLTRKTSNCDSFVQKICLLLQKETSHSKNSLALRPQGPKQYTFGDHFYTKNAKKLRLHVFFLFHVRKHVISFYLKWIQFTRIYAFCSKNDAKNICKDTTWSFFMRFGSLSTISFI